LRRIQKDYEELEQDRNSWPTRLGEFVGWWVEHRDNPDTCTVAYRRRRSSTQSDNGGKPCVTSGLRWCSASCYSGIYSDVMFCSKCGAGNSDRGNYCQKCGSPLSREALTQEQRQLVNELLPIDQRPHECHACGRTGGLYGWDFGLGTPRLRVVAGTRHLAN
jgi:hypothetical protein